MKIFKYNQQNPCPTDRHVFPIYKSYKNFMNETLTIWKKGVVNQLLMHRDYIDLASCRIKLADSKEGIVPVISLKPQVSLDFDDKIGEYVNFFNQYDILKNDIIKEVFFAETLADKKTYDRSYLIARINSIKILIASFNNDTYHPSAFEVIIKDPTTEEAARSARELGVSHVVGGDFVKGGLLQSESDSDLIGSFYKYVRKSML